MKSSFAWLCLIPALLVSLQATAQPTEGRKRVLLVIAQQDFFYNEYAHPKAALEEAGIAVDVAAASKAPCNPHANTGQQGDGVVRPDLAIAEADARDYDAILFAGGWGASMYQYGFPGVYENAAYNGDKRVKESVNKLINDLVKQEKYVCGLCHGTSVLAWARVGGKSLLAGKNVAAPTINGPHGRLNNRPLQGPSRGHCELNGARVSASGSLGQSGSTADDVLVDGKIITGEDDKSARELGRILAEKLRGK